MFKRVVVECKNETRVETEILFNIAGARANGKKLVRLDFKNEAKSSVFNHQKQIMLSLLREMKRDGRIQFFATEQSFDKMKLEAQFLYNKYESFIDLTKESDKDVFVYILL